VIAIRAALDKAGVPYTTGSRKPAPARKIERLTAPAAWASLIVNNDDTGLTPDEAYAAVEWLASEGFAAGSAVDARDIGFRTFHDAHSFAPGAVECCEYSFIVG
jgi:hypothetical protein